jgi:hypothetical protein
MAAQADIQRRLIFHGAVVLVVAIFSGFPSVVEVATNSGRMWQAAHAALLVLGVWIIATAAVFPLLLLAKREAVGLAWSLVAVAYSFTTAVVLQAATGVRAISPGGTILTGIAFAANLIAVLSAFLVATLTLLGAWNGFRKSRDALTAPVAE